MSQKSQLQQAIDEANESGRVSVQCYKSSIVAAKTEELMMELARLEAKVEQYEIDISQRMTNTFDRESITKVVRRASEMHSNATQLNLSDIHRFKVLMSRAGALRRFKMGDC